MSEAYDNCSFVPIFLKICRALMRWTPRRFLGEVVVMSPHDWGTHLEWGVEGRGWRLSPNFFRMRVYLIHWNTFLRGSTHFTFHGGTLIYIYISCFHDDVIKWRHIPHHWLLCGEFTGDCAEFTAHRWIPLMQTSDAELWCFLWSAPEQTVEQTIKTSVTWDAIALAMTSL